ncbi:MAG: glycoside hydrolase family 10 protein, partial [Nocardioidaceae bacterium]
MRAHRRRRLLAVLFTGALGTALLIGLPAAAPAVSGSPPTHEATAAHRPPTCTPDPHAEKASLRAMWIATVANIDWPSKPGLSIEQQKSELVSYLDMAQAQGHNAVVLQVRPTADAFWPSDVEPWSKYLTGVAGQDPGYDPLAFAVAQAHARNLELHAWFNPFRVSMDTDRGALAPDSPARQHPDWVVSYGGQLYYNPGIPAVRELSEDAIMDAVTKYDIDAVHFDDYFYPYPSGDTPFPDQKQYEKYGAGFDNVGDWRRDNINGFMQDLGDRIKEAKPWVKFGVSPFAVWRNKSSDPRGSDTTAGAETYDDLYADTRLWVKRDWIDYVAPQVYWARGFAPADYEKVSSWWADVVDGTDVALYIGQATYKVGTSSQSPDWSEPDVLSRQLEFNTTLPEVKGNIYFSAKQVRADRLGATTILNQTWYSHPALVPPMPWIDDRAPKHPKQLHARSGEAGVHLSWRAGDASTTSYAVYRLQRDDHGKVKGSDCRLADATHL